MRQPNPQMRPSLRDVREGTRLVESLLSVSPTNTIIEPMAHLHGGSARREKQEILRLRSEVAAKDKQIAAQQREISRLLAQLDKASTKQQVE
mmetsp:Transcript_15366/g.17390  ORF Transcript_15366/g.17390 Transcript_15366/m.17390 type:complete len:92 (-) Transcript_15366:221-496(-)